MIYPEFLKEKGTIGITAPSAGIGDDPLQLEMVRRNFRELGFNLVETRNVSSRNEVSSSGRQRARQLDELVRNPDVDVIMSASGGDYLMEMLPYINWQSFVDSPKWFCGYSDPTSILYVLTTKYDIASIYGYNAASFCSNRLMKHQLTTVEFLKGNTVKQNSYPRYEDFETYDRYNPKFIHKVEWKANADFKVKGRLIGGCLECLNLICGTELDNTVNFIEKYRDDGIIWALDNFAMSSDIFYQTLWKMKYLGWFRYTKAVVLGRCLFERINTRVDYQKALIKIFGKDMPIITEACIGHVTPCFTLILGAMATVETKKGKGSIRFELK